MTRVLLILALLNSIVFAGDPMSDMLTKGCKQIVKGDDIKWGTDSVSTAFYIHGLTDMSYRINNMIGNKLDMNKAKEYSYNKIAVLACHKALQDTTNVNIKEILGGYILEKISSFYISGK